MVDSPDILTGADGHAYVPIEEKHGDSCTCRSMGHIHVELVAASRASPGDRNPHRAGTIAAQLDDFEPPYYPGRVVITWGGIEPKGRQTTVHDADTGELIPVTELRLDLDANTAGFAGPIIVQARMLVDQKNEPLRGDRAVMPYPDLNHPGSVLTYWFRCPVAEMRTAPVDPTVPTRESVNRGEHTINQYREHHGIDGAHADLVVTDETQADADPMQ